MADPFDPRNAETVRPGAPTVRTATALSSPAATPARVDLGPQAGSLIAGRYQVIRQMNHGGEADIYLCTDTTSHTEVVVKIYRADFKNSAAVLNTIRGLEHPNVLKLLDFGDYASRCYEVAEYAVGGTLDQFLPFTEAAILRDVLPQVISAFRFFQSKEIVHRDIKPENLFYRDAQRKQIVVGDYGLSSTLKSSNPEFSTRMTSRAGFTLSYAAPELYAGVGQGSKGQLIGREIDYYALGITLLKMLSGRDPFAGMDSAQVFRVKQNLEVPIPPNCSTRLITLIRGLLHPTPRLRWGLSEVERWLKGEIVSVPGLETPQAAFFYKLSDDLVATNQAQLARQLLENRALGLEHLPKVLPTYFVNNNQPVAVVVNKVLAKWGTGDAALTELIYTWDKNLPYILVPGTSAESPKELAAVIDRNAETWSAGKAQLASGQIESWLRHRALTSITTGWDTVKAQYAGQPDAGLEYFLHLLNPDLAPPTLRIEPDVISFGAIEPGQRKSRRFTITNPGRGYLSGTITLADRSPGLTLAGNHFAGRSTQFEVTANTASLDRGARYNSELIVTSNTGSPVRVPVRFRVGFPWLPVLISMLRRSLWWGAFFLAVRWAVGYFGHWGMNWLDERAQPVLLLPDLTLRINPSYNPLIVWAVVGLLLGACSGISYGGNISRTPVARWAGNLLFLALIPGLYWQTQSYPAMNAMYHAAEAKVTSRLEGEWTAQVGSEAAQMTIRQAGDKLEGEIEYDGVLEKLAVTWTRTGTGIQVVLQGTEWKPVSGQHPSFSLDRFQGTLSAGAEQISGSYKDARGSTGTFSATRTPGSGSASAWTVTRGGEVTTYARRVAAGANGRIAIEITYVGNASWVGGGLVAASESFDPARAAVAVTLKGGEKLQLEIAADGTMTARYGGATFSQVKQDWSSLILRAGQPSEYRVTVNGTALAPIRDKGGVLNLRFQH